MLKRLTKNILQRVDLPGMRQGYIECALMNVSIANEFSYVEQVQMQEYEQFLQEMNKNWLLKEEKSIMLT